MNYAYSLIWPIAFLSAWVATPWFGSLSRRFGVIDRPSARKIHQNPTPKGGGGAVVAGMGLAAIAAIMVFDVPIQRISLFLAVTIATAIVGWIDDKVELSPGRKLLLMAVPAFLWTLNTQPPTVMGVLNALLNAVFLVLAMNAVNLIDGLDGLAAGYGSISALLLGLIGWVQGDHFVTVLALALSGATAGFLPHNWQPAWIFMGDTGSLVIGFALAGLAMSLRPEGLLLVKLPIALAILAVPFFDTSVAIIRRLKQKQPIFAADKSHTYNLLVQRGLSVRYTVGLIYIVALAFGCLGLWYAATPVTWVRIALPLFGACILLYLALRYDFLQTTTDAIRLDRVMGSEGSTHRYGKE